MKFGAVLPPELEWQRNKTAATILFVQEAERLLISNLLLPEQHFRLSSFVMRVKHGEADVTDFSALDNFFDIKKEYNDSIVE